MHSGFFAIDSSLFRNMRAMARNLATRPKVALSTLVLVLLVAHQGAVDAQEGASRGLISGNNLNGQFFPAILLCLLALANRAGAGGGSGLLIGLANVSKCVNLGKYEILKN